MTKTTIQHFDFSEFTIETLQHISEFCESVPSMVEYINNRYNVVYSAATTDNADTVTTHGRASNITPDDTIKIGDDGTLLNL